MDGLFRKFSGNPLLGPGTEDTFFDCCVVPVAEGLRMYLSWRDRGSLACGESGDGVSWSPPREVLRPEREWEKDGVNRPCVVETAGGWWMWYTGQNQGAQSSAIGLAHSEDGLRWEREGEGPVLSPIGGWEKRALMCPHVLEENGRFRMWYSGGDRYEPDALGYAESADGRRWERAGDNPVLRPAEGWEAARVAGACVVRREQDYLAFYIGFAEGYERSQIGMARSPDGVRGWERYPGNPVLGPGAEGEWDDCNVYKPYVLPGRDQWWLWYNASRGGDRREQIGLAVAEELDEVW
jgi:predicted GH43/DUF377 family glycosyl hydrolase